MKNAIITELNNRGINAELHTVIKNGVSAEGIMIINDSNVSPVIYFDGLLNLSIDEAVDKVISIYNANVKPDFDLDILFNKDYILDHVAIAVQRTGTENIIKRDTDFEGIEAYILVIDEGFSFKVATQLLDILGIDLDSLWTKAEANTRANIKFRDFMGLTILSNKYSVKGASGILFNDVLKDFAADNNCTKVGVIPSSIHEVILLPADDVDLDILSSMVGEVNGAEVLPEEQLSDRAYIVEV